MPHLKDLDCSIELTDSQRKLQEFGTIYGDGFVETFVPVPSKPQSFSVHLTSEKFIAPGISMYVFVDGVYQCNRNRQDLKLRKGSDSRSVVDFRVRQKEEKQKDGSMIAREWKFEKLISADEAPDVCSSNVLDNIGCIEVLVLRCAGPRTAKTVSSINMDGASDFLPQPSALALDGHSDGRSMYDDRSPLFNSSGPPPPVPSYHAPYAETVHSHNTRSRTHHSREPPPFFSSYGRRPGSHSSDPVSPGARPPSIPSEAYQYGSGPIPTGPMMGSERSFYNTRPSSAVVANAPGVDPKWLNQVLTEAVKRGVEESRRADTAPAPIEQSTRAFDTQSQVPGAWPSSPFPPGTAPVQHSEQPQHKHNEVQNDSGTTLGGTPGWNDNKTATHVGWDTQSSAESWGAKDETESDTWDTGDTWEKKSTDDQRSRHWSRSRAPTVHARSERRPSTSVIARTHKSRHSKDDRTRKSRSKSRSRTSHWNSKPRSSSEDRDGWTHVDADVDTPTSFELSDDTLQPSQSRSQYRSSRPRSRSRRRSQRTHSTHGKTRRSSRSRWDDGDGHGAGATPTIMNASSTIRAPTVLSRRESKKFEHAPSVAPPPTTWAPAPTDKSRKHSIGVTSVLPAPFSTLGKDFANASEHDWKAASTWDDTGDVAKVKDSWSAKDDSWGNEDSGWDSKDTPNKKEPSAWGAGENKWDTVEGVKPAWETSDDTWTYDTKIAPPKPPSSSAPKRHTTKSLSKYRQLSSPSPSPKPHWQIPPTPSPSTKKLTSISEGKILPPEPPLKLSSAQASEAGIEHQVRAGPGTTYGHAVGRPEYLDTLDKPYAVFRFKYRSRGVLKDMFGEEVVPEHGSLTTHTSSSKVKKEKEKLKEVSKDELIEKMVRLKMKLEEGREKDKGKGKGERRDGKRAKSVDTEVVARGLTEKWVKQHSREASEKGREKGGGKEKRARSERKSEKKGGEDGWGEGADDGDGGWGGADATW